jgi:MOSC domain-containing protein YiiM
MPIVISIQIGRATTYAHQGNADGKLRTYSTAFVKSPIAGSIFVGTTGVAGDQQADRQNHGGLDKAILAYSADHYPYWQQHLNLSNMPCGGFGENLTIEGLDETGICIGDRWQAGNITLEVSQPRQPCWKLGRRWQIADLPKQVIQNGRSGWYLRVLNEGELIAGTPIELMTRPHPAWSVARANRLLYHEHDNVLALEELANIPELSRAWSEELLERIARRPV